MEIFICVFSLLFAKQAVRPSHSFTPWEVYVYRTGIRNCLKTTASWKAVLKGWSRVG